MHSRFNIQKKRRISTLLLICLLISACGSSDKEAPLIRRESSGYALLGRIANADVAIFDMDESFEDPVYRTTTTRDSLLIRNGLINIPPEKIDAEHFYLIVVNAAGLGVDVDADNNGQIDSSPIAVVEPLHALISGTDLLDYDTSWNVTPLTEIIYAFVRYELSIGVTGNALQDLLDSHASRLVQAFDATRCTTNATLCADYKDVLRWQPLEDRNLFQKSVVMLDAVSIRLRQGDQPVNNTVIFDSRASSDQRSQALEKLSSNISISTLAQQLAPKEIAFVPLKDTPRHLETTSLLRADGSELKLLIAAGSSISIRDLTTPSNPQALWTNSFDQPLIDMAVISAASQSYLLALFDGGNLQAGGNNLDSQQLRLISLAPLLDGDTQLVAQSIDFSELFSELSYDEIELLDMDAEGERIFLLANIINSGTNVPSIVELNLEIDWQGEPELSLADTPSHTLTMSMARGEIVYRNQQLCVTNNNYLDLRIARINTDSYATSYNNLAPASGDAFCDDIDPGNFICEGDQAWQILRITEDDCDINFRDQRQPYYFDLTQASSTGTALNWESALSASALFNIDDNTYVSSATQSVFHYDYSNNLAGRYSVSQQIQSNTRGEWLSDLEILVIPVENGVVLQSRPGDNSDDSRPAYYTPRDEFDNEIVVRNFALLDAEFWYFSYYTASSADLIFGSTRFNASRDNQVEFSELSGHRFSLSSTPQGLFRVFSYTGGWFYQSLFRMQLASGSVVEQAFPLSEITEFTTLHDSISLSTNTERAALYIELEGDIARDKEVIYLYNLADELATPLEINTATIKDEPLLATAINAKIADIAARGSDVESNPLTVNDVKVAKLFLRSNQQLIVLANVVLKDSQNRLLEEPLAFLFYTLEGLTSAELNNVTAVAELRSSAAASANFADNALYLSANQQLLAYEILADTIVQRSSLELSANVYDMLQLGDFLYIADSDTSIVDLQNPLQPEILGFAQSSPRQLQTDGTSVYALSGNEIYQIQPPMQRIP